jgi:hypothetical protein
MSSRRSPFDEKKEREKLMMLEYPRNTECDGSAYLGDICLNDTLSTEIGAMIVQEVFSGNPQFERVGWLPA